MSNSDNPKNGARFQAQVQDWFTENHGEGFELEVPIEIGVNTDLVKEHRFDIVNREKKIVIECKRYTWTETGNVPSAKMGFLNEAAFYLSLLPEEYEKFIVIYYSYHEKKGMTLAEYYFQMNRHLLGKTKIAEYNPRRREFRVVGEN